MSSGDSLFQAFLSDPSLGAIRGCIDFKRSSATPFQWKTCSDKVEKVFRQSPNVSPCAEGDDA